MFHKKKSTTIQKCATALIQDNQFYTVVKSNEYCMELNEEFTQNYFQMYVYFTVQPTSNYGTVLTPYIYSANAKNIS